MPRLYAYTRRENLEREDGHTHTTMPRPRPPVPLGLFARQLAPIAVRPGQHSRRLALGRAEPLSEWRPHDWRSAGRPNPYCNQLQVQRVAIETRYHLIAPHCPAPGPRL